MWAARDVSWEAGGRGGDRHGHGGDVDYAGHYAPAPTAPGAVGAADAVEAVLVPRPQAAQQTRVVVVADDDAVDVVVWRDGKAGDPGLASGDLESSEGIVEPWVGGQRG